MGRALNFRLDSDSAPSLCFSTGFPNVGKSSLINGLVGRKVVSVSRTPGHTKYFQTYFLTPTVKLCDCPGLIFPSLVDRQQQVNVCNGDSGICEKSCVPELGARNPGKTGMRWEARFLLSFQ